VSLVGHFVHQLRLDTQGTSLVGQFGVPVLFGGSGVLG